VLFAIALTLAFLVLFAVTVPVALPITVAFALPVTLVLLALDGVSIDGNIADRNIDETRVVLGA
jgi:hypothetical protein